VIFSSAQIVISSQEMLISSQGSNISSSETLIVSQEAAISSRETLISCQDVTIASPKMPVSTQETATSSTFSTFHFSVKRAGQACNTAIFLLESCSDGKKAAAGDRRRN
jgi:hypothetical protein